MSHLEQDFLAVINAMKNRYVLEVKFRGARGSVHARRGYFVGSGMR